MKNNSVGSSRKVERLYNPEKRQEEFFEGYSMPRNQEIMRIFKDLELVEHLGSGVPRIDDHTRQTQ